MYLVNEENAAIQYLVGGNMTVEVLLSTYNGEDYLREQLESLLSQSYKDFFVTIRDDGSSDATISIIEEYVSKYPGTFFLLVLQTSHGMELI